MRGVWTCCNACWFFCAGELLHIFPLFPADIALQILYFFQHPSISRISYSTCAYDCSGALALGRPSLSTFAPLITLICKLMMNTHI